MAMRLSNEELPSLDFVKTPYMIYNDELLGHFIIVLSNKRALIHEFESKEYYEVNESNTYNFMMKIAETDYLDNPSGGTLRYVPISEGVKLAKIVDLITSARDTSIEIIGNSTNRELSECNVLKDSIYVNIDINAVRIDITTRIHQLYGATISTLIRF